MCEGSSTGKMLMPVRRRPLMGPSLQSENPMELCRLVALLAKGRDIDEICQGTSPMYTSWSCRDVCW